MLESFFFYGNLPHNLEKGFYQLPLVILSYLVASFASYTALSMAEQLAVSGGRWEKRLFHWGGAFAMGAGIWSMHFIGMLSYKMRMVVSYDWGLTFLSMLIAIVVAYWVLAIVTHSRLSLQRLLTGAVFLGLGICGMHYTGMEAMRMDGELRYIPGIFLLSVIIAITASAAALWMTFTLARHGGSGFRILLQMGAALVMGAAICGMHYTGMAAAVFIPYADCRFDPDQSFESLALTVGVITSIILGIALCIGAYKRAQVEFRLHSNEARLRAMIDSSLDAVVAMDQQGLITEWNKQAENIFGWRHEEALGKPLKEMIVPAVHRAAHERGMQKFLKEGAGPILGKRIEMPAVNKKGAEFPVELAVTAQKHGDAYQFTAFIRDITEQKKGEKDQALLAAIVRSSDDAILSKTLESKITSWNAGAEKLFGYSEAEAVGQHISLIIPLERITEEKYIIDQMRLGRTIEHFETQRITKSGQLIDISVTLSPIFDPEGRITGVSKVARDITERKKSEAALQKYMKDLERSNQDLEDFAHIASHDLKEPLRGLATVSAFLMEDYQDKLDDKGFQWLNRLVDLSARMERLIGDLLYYSRLGRAELAIQATDPNVVIDEIRVMLEIFLKERNAVIAVPKPMPAVVCDKTRVTEIFRNLITNAVKYNNKPERLVEVGFLEEADTPAGREQNVFYVRDNGIGIAPEFHQEIFRIFKKLDSRIEDKDAGTGVGLTFVKKIVERHGGRIWLESVPGKGTTFYFTLNLKGSMHD
jgi:PAS domain S-box-containing protein